jgi:hypothetical protein
MLGQKWEEKQYQRGVVLGLTMAEIILLLLFLLLLLLSVKLSELLGQRDKALSEKAQVEKQLTDLKEKTRSPDGGVTIFDWQKEYLKLKSDFDRVQQENKAAKPVISLADESVSKGKAKSREEAVENIAADARMGAHVKEEASKRFPDQAHEDPVSQLIAAADEGEAVSKKASVLFPEDQPNKAVEKLISAAEVGKSSSLDKTNYAEALTKADACSKELSTCKGQTIDLTRQIGGTLPSCWTTEDGTKEFLFDLTFRNDGIYVKDNAVPGRENDQAQLPLAQFVYDHPMSAGKFTAAGKAILELSRSKDCRYYVRIFDQTDNNKARFNDLRFAVESAFYKREMDKTTAKRVDKTPTDRPEPLIEDTSDSEPKKDEWGRQ